MRVNSRTILLIAMVALAAGGMALPGTAIAEETTLCSEDTGKSPCPEGKVVSHVHETTTVKAKLLASPEVQCDVLFLGEVGTSGSPQVIEGNFTYSNCGAGCSVTEEGGPTIIEVLREGHEKAKVTGEGEVRVLCFGINCYYNGEELEATGKGPLLSTAANGEVNISDQTLKKVKGLFCPSTGKLDINTTPLQATYLPPPDEEYVPHKTALCTADEATSTCVEENKLSSIDFKDSAVEFLTNLVNSKCEGLISSTSIGEAGKPQEVKVEYKFSSCTNGCVVTEVSGGSKLAFLLEESGLKVELASVTTKGLELFYKCGETAKCTFGPIEAVGHSLGALTTEDNGHITFSKDSLGKGEGLLCPSEATLDALFVASSATYIREDYAKPPTSLCSKDEKSPVCKSENQLKTIDYKDKAVELLTSLINVKCEGLVSGTVGTPAAGKSLEVTPELTYTGCSGGCFVTSVAGPGKIVLERSKSEEAKATSEGFEIFVKCGTTIKCLLGPEKMTGTALGALTTGDNGHLTFSKVSLGKGEGATCPKEATLDALYVASSAAYIG